MVKRNRLLADALNAGASGFLLKDASAPELLAAIRAVHRGDSVVAPAATRPVLAVGSSLVIEAA